MCKYQYCTGMILDEKYRRKPYELKGYCMLKCMERDELLTSKLNNDKLVSTS